MTPRARLRGFTLLEVLVAIAILGLGLTVILSSQAGLFSSASRGEHLTVASNLLRCKMSEIEVDLEQRGFQLTDENDEGECCEGESEGYNCSWKIERVELPPLPEASDLDGGVADGAEQGALGPLGAIAGVSSAQGAPLGEGSGPDALMEQLGSASGSGMEGMVMGFVYPSLKPMLEASIRRVTVKVTWREGVRERDLEVVQFLTRPQEGALGTSEQLGLDQLSQNPALNEGATPGAGTGTQPGRGTQPGSGSGSPLGFGSRMGGRVR